MEGRVEVLLEAVAPAIVGQCLQVAGEGGQVLREIRV